MNAQATSIDGGRERQEHRAGAVVGELSSFLDSLVEPVVCIDRQRKILYRNPVFAASWRTPLGACLVAKSVEGGSMVIEVSDHAGRPCDVWVDLTSIPDANGRPIAFLALVRADETDVIGELRYAAALITSRIASLDDTGALPRWSDEVAQLIETLSKREREIFDLIVDGNRVATVASELFLSEHTVRNYLKRIYQKLDVHSLGELRELVGRSGGRSAS